MENLLLSLLFVACLESMLFGIAVQAAIIVLAIRGYYVKCRVLAYPDIEIAGREGVESEVYKLMDLYYGMPCFRLMNLKIDSMLNNRITYRFEKISRDKFVIRVEVKE